MKQEETNEKSRQGTKIRVASAKLRAVIIARAQRVIDNADYLPLADLQREIREIGELLASHSVPGRRYTVACPANAARELILSLLQIPDVQASITTDDTPKNDAEASIEVAKATDDARRTAHTVWGGDGSSATVENFHRELSKADNPLLVEQLLTGPRAEASEVQGATGERLAAIPQAPKFLPSGSTHQVGIDIKLVDRDQSLASVKVGDAENPEAAALSGLLGRRVSLKFDVEQLAGIDSMLMLAQATDVRVRVRVHVRRGLGKANMKLDELRVAEILQEAQTRAEISRRLVEMQAMQLDMIASLDESRSS